MAWRPPKRDIWEELCEKKKVCRRKPPSPSSGHFKSSVKREEAGDIANHSATLNNPSISPPKTKKKSRTNLAHPVGAKENVGNPGARPSISGKVRRPVTPGPGRKESRPTIKKSGENSMSRSGNNIPRARTPGPPIQNRSVSRTRPKSPFEVSRTSSMSPTRRGYTPDGKKTPSVTKKDKELGQEIKRILEIGRHGPEPTASAAPPKTTSTKKKAVIAASAASAAVALGWSVLGFLL